MIQHYLDLAQYEESNHNLVNMMLWIEAYPLFKCQHENWLILLGIHEGTLFIYMPLCSRVYFREALLEAKSIFDHYGLPFVLSCFTQQPAQWVQQIFPQLCLTENRDSADYVYLAEKLKTFAGKRLQKKRNHLNAFYRDYAGRWSYETLDEHNVAECEAFLKQWHAEDPDAFLQQERRGVKRAAPAAEHAARVHLQNAPRLTAGVQRLQCGGAVGGALFVEQGAARIGLYHQIEVANHIRPGAQGIFRHGRVIRLRIGQAVLAKHLFDAALGCVLVPIHPVKTVCSLVVQVVHRTDDIIQLVPGRKMGERVQLKARGHTDLARKARLGAAQSGKVARLVARGMRRLCRQAGMV